MSCIADFNIYIYIIYMLGTLVNSLSTSQCSACLQAQPDFFKQVPAPSRSAVSTPDSVILYRAAVGFLHPVAH
jgi:hypothetical protein